MRCLAPIILFGAALASAQSPAPPVPPAPTEIHALVKQLGSDEYASREEAGKKLTALGAPALDELRDALRSDNPEVVRRARDILRRIEQRLDNEKTLAPTLVELDVADTRLDDLLAELSKQASCNVVLGGLKQGELADRRLTLSTRGKVPFWSAILRICDAADLQVAAAGGFLAPDAMPYLGRAPRGVRVAANTEKTIVLEARGEVKRRPAAVYGAVLVEAVPFPKKGEHPGASALLQVWPEPRLAWQATRGLKVATAVDGSGTKLVADTTTPVIMPPAEIRRGGMVIIRNADGTGRIVDGSGFEVMGAFRPNARQAQVRFSKEGAIPDVVKELGVSVYGTVRSGIEPIAQAGGLQPGKTTTASSVAGVDMTVQYSKDASGRLMARIVLEYERSAVEHAGVGVELPGVKAGGPGLGNQSVHGVRITDASGKPFTLGFMGGSGRSGRGTRESMSLTLELHPDRDGNGPPATVTFWGTHAKPIEVPVLLKDVPLVGK